MILFFKSWVKPFTYVNHLGNTVEVPGYHRKDVKRGLPDNERKALVDRYRAGESCPEIAASTGMSTSAVWGIVDAAGAIRPHSEAMALRMASRPNLSEHRGVQLLYHSSKTGKWVPAGSRYEFIRMDQLEHDPDVVSFGRSTDRIPYNFDGSVHHYIPDLEVVRADGSVIVEEIKPSNMTIGGKVHAKILAAMQFYRDRGKRFVVITEDDIGWSNIKNFNWSGFSEMVNADRQAINAEKERTRHREAKRKLLAAMTPDERDERNRLQREHYANKVLSDAELAERRAKNAIAAKESRARKKATHILFFE